MSRVVCSFISNSFLDKLLQERSFKDNSVGALELSSAITTYQTYHRELTNEELLDKNIQRAILGIIELSRENAKEEARIKEQYEDELLTILDNAPRDEQGRLLAPNGKVSNLTERQYAQVRTKAFKEWFGDWENNPANASKVVDENGEPLVVYHGSDYKDDATIIGDWSKNALPYATYFAPYQGYANFKHVYSAFLNIKNPIYSDELLTEEAIQDEDVFKKFIIDRGYDGAISGTQIESYKTPSNATKAREIVVVNPNQIKSATDNSGAFSTTNDRIDRFGEGKKSDIINKLLDRITDGTNYYTQDDINYLHSRNLSINQIFTGNNIKEVLESFKSSIRKAIDKYILENHYDLGVATLRRLKLEGNLSDKDSYYNFIQLLQNNIIDKLLKSGKTIEIKPDSNFTAAMGARVNGSVVSLVYNPRLLLMDNERLDYILAHELVHTVTSNSINNVTSNTATEAEQLFYNDIWNIIVDLNDNKNFYWDFGYDVFDATLRGSHIKEFVANVMTNPELLKSLAQIKTDKKLSLWSRFINAIKSLLNKYLGINISDSYLEKLVNTISLHIEKLSLSLQNYGYDAMTEGEKVSDKNLQQKEIQLSTTGYKKGDPLKNPNIDYVFTENAEAYVVSNKVALDKIPDFPNQGKTKLNVSDVNGTNQAGIRTDSKGNISPNAYGIVVKKYQLDANGRFVAKEGQFQDADEDFALFVKLNEDMFKRLSESSNKKIVFPTQMGLGKAALPMRFAEWLQARLSEKFGILSTIEKNARADYDGYGLRLNSIELKQPQQTLSLTLQLILTLLLSTLPMETKETKEDKAAELAKKQELERKKKIVSELKESLKAERPIDLADLIDKSEFTNILYNAIPDIVERRALISTFSIMFSVALDTKFKTYKTNLNSTPNEDLSDEEILLKNALNSGTEEEQKIALLNMAKVGNDALPKAIINQIWNLVQMISTVIDNEGNVNEDRLELFAKSLLFDNGKFKRNNIFGEEFYQKCKLELENSRKSINRQAIANETIKRLATSFKKISDIGVFLAIINKASAELEYNENIKLATSLNGTERTAVDNENIDEEGSVDNRSGLNLVKYKMLLPSKTMSIRIKKLLGSVYKMKDGKYEFNTLGFRVKINPHIAYHTLIGRFAKMNRPEDFYDIIDSTIQDYPWFEEIVEKLEDNEDLRNEFYSAFRNVFVQYKLINSDGTFTNLNLDNTAETVLDLVTNDYESGNALGANSIYNADSGCWTENVSKTSELFKPSEPLGLAIKALAKYKELSTATERNKEKIISGIIDTIKLLRGIDPNHKSISLEALLNNLGIDTIDMDLGVLLPNVDIVGYSELDGISLEDALLQVFTEELANKLVKILTSAHTIVNNHLGNGFTLGMHLTRNFRSAYLVIGNNLPIAAKRYTEVSFNFNNKQRTSYSAPDFISELVGILSNIKDDKSIEVAKLYIEDNFKKYDYFYDPILGKWRHSWLELLYEAVTNKDKKSLELMSRFAYLNILGINGGAGDNTIGKVEKQVFTSGIIKSFFTTTVDSYGNEYGNYRNPLFSDVDALVLFTFKKYTGDNLEEIILDKLVDIFEAEYDRILFYKNRTNHTNDITFYSDEKGNSKKFFFFPYLNSRINEIIRELSSIQSNGDLYWIDRSEIIKSYILPYLQDKFEQFYNEYGTDLLYRQIKDLKNNTIEKADVLLIIEKAFQELQNEEETLNNEATEEDRKEDELTDQERENIKELNKRKLFQEFYYNDYLAHIELTRLLLGDPAMFKNMDDAIKRAKQVYASGKKGYFLDENGNRMKERAMYMEDRELMSPTWKLLDDLLEQSSDFTKMDKALMRGAIARIMGDYKSINTTDGQSFRTLKSLRTILKSMGGKWTDDMESTYNRLLNGTFTGADFATFWNSVKPFLSSHELRYIENDLGKVRAEKVVTLHKNSEYVISALYTVLNTKLNSSPLLRGLQKFMEKNDIDVVHFKSVVKEGFNNPFDLTYDKEAFEEFKKHPNRSGVTFKVDSWKGFVEDAQNKLLKGVISQDLYNELIKTFTFEGKNPNIEQKVFSALTSQLLNRRGKVNKDMIHEFDLNDYIIMQPTDDHLMDEVAVFGSQLRNILPADISPNTVIKVKINGEEVPLTGEEAVDYYNTLITDLLLDSFSKVDRLFRNAVLLKNYIDLLVKGNPKYGQDVIDALQLTEDKKAFVMPFNSPNLLNKIEEIILSAFKNAIQRLKITGGSAVLVSNFALSNDLLIKYKNNDPKLGIEYIPAYMPASMMDVYRDYLIEKTDESGNTYYTVDFKTFERNADKDLLNIIGYRIPTEAKYSIMPIRIMGFMPVTLGTTIMLPSDIITMSGTDFDIDKLFLMIKKAEVAIAGKDMINAANKYIGKEIKDEKPIVIALLKKDYLTLADINILTKLSKKFNDFYLEKGKEYLYKPTERKLKVLRGRYDDNQSLLEASELNNVKSPLRRKYIRDNMLIDLAWGILTSPEVSALSAMPGQFETLKSAAIRARILNDELARKTFMEMHEGENIIEALYEADDKELEEFFNKYGQLRDFADILDYADTHDNLMQGNDLIGRSAVNSSNHYKLQFVGAKIKDEISENLSFKGHKLSLISSVYSPIDGHRITLSQAEVQAAAPDNGKFPVLGYLNVNNNTINRFDLFIKLGIPLMDASMLNVIEPHLGVIFRLLNMTPNDVRLKEAGEFDGDIYKAMDLVYRAINNPTELSELDRKDLGSFVSWYYILDDMSKELSNISSVSRCDSTNGALPVSVAEAILQQLRAERFINTIKSDASYFTGLDGLIDTELDAFDDNIRDKLLLSKIPRLQAAYTLGIQGGLRMASRYLPLLDTNVLAALRELSKYTKSSFIYTKDLSTIKTFYKELNTFIFTLNSIFSGNDKYSTIDKRNYYIHDFPIKFKEFLSLNANQSIRRYSIIRNLLNSPKLGIVYANIGKNSSLIRQYFSEELDALGFSDRAEVRDFALDLLMYSFYNNGLNYTHNSFGVLFSTAFLSSVPRFIDSLRGSTSVVTLNREYLSKFINQFILNNPSIIPLASDKDYNLNLDKTLTIHRPTEIGRGPNSVMYIGLNGILLPLPFIRVKFYKNGKRITNIYVHQEGDTYVLVNYNTTGNAVSYAKTPYYNANSNLGEFEQELENLKSRGRATISDKNLRKLNAKNNKVNNINNQDMNSNTIGNIVDTVDLYDGWNTSSTAQNFDVNIMSALSDASEYGQDNLSDNTSDDVEYNPTLRNLDDINKSELSDEPSSEGSINEEAEPDNNPDDKMCVNK